MRLCSRCRLLRLSCGFEDPDGPFVVLDARPVAGAGARAAGTRAGGRLSTGGRKDGAVPPGVNGHIGIGRAAAREKPRPAQLPSGPYLPAFPRAMQHYASRAGFSRRSLPGPSSGLAALVSRRYRGHPVIASFKTATVHLHFAFAHCRRENHHWMQ